MHSPVALAVSSLGLMSIGLVSWMYLHHRWPEIGQA
jgi:DHA1 family bicyclomycin/chloramphenicol resistance-like MFS transporter